MLAWRSDVGDGDTEGDHRCELPTLPARRAGERTDAGVASWPAGDARLRAELRLPAGTTRPPPRHRSYHLPGLNLPQRKTGLAAIVQARRHQRIRRRLARRPDPDHRVVTPYRDATA